MVHFLSAVIGFIHFLASTQQTPNAGSDQISTPVLDNVAGPLLTAAQFLIPTMVAISAIHKMMEHRESGGAALIEILTKGGGAILLLQLIKAIGWVK